MKIINRELPFTSKTEWVWPDNDKKLVQVFEHVTDIDVFMKHVDNAHTCVQAGGAAGVWPYRYAQLFNTVHTFEPMPENRECLLANTTYLETNTTYTPVSTCDIHVYPYALSDEAMQHGAIVFEKTEQDNYGAVYFTSDVDENTPRRVSTSTIDNLDLLQCDLIQLDIEGHELEALLGGLNTIQKFKPVIVLEEKPLPQLKRDYKEPRYLLERLGYAQVDAVHRDVVFAYNGAV